MLYANESVRIVPFTRAHMTGNYRSWFYDREITRNNTHGLFPYTDEAMERFWREIDSRERIVWAIEMRTERPFLSEEHIGNVSLQSLNFIHRSAELAIILSISGKGYGTKVCAWVLEHAFVLLNLHRVWTGTAASNEGMKRICEKIGMQHEGTYKDGMWLRGAFVNVEAYGIVKKDWEKRRDQ
jgi:RimJ/RimL family protein N-acetyltransferase